LQQSKAEGFMRGALFITIGSLISRVLGVFYRPVAQIPLGDEGLALVTPPNAPYMLILAISSAGLNVAISRLVSQRLAIGDLRGARRVVHVAFTLLAISGILFSLLFALGARWMATAQGFPEATPGFLALSPAILLVTLEVAFRGLYQGMQRMRPSAVSMVVEQAGRVIIGLAGVFLLTPFALNLGAAAFNAGNTIGVLLGALYALYIYLRERPMADWSTVAPGVESWESESVLALGRRIFAIALPLSFLGTVLPLVQMADVSIITNRLISIGVEPTAAKMARLRALVPAYALYGGLGGVSLLYELDAGAAGTMTGFALPSVLASIVSAHQAGDHNLAQERFERALPLLDFEAQPGVGVALRKELLRQQGAIAHATVRQPAPTADPFLLATLNKLLARQPGIAGAPLG